MWCLYSRALPKLTLNSPRSPRSLCPVESMWPRHQTTPCSWLLPPKLSPTQGWLRSCLSHQSNPPWWRTPACVAASATPHSQGTWTSPQDWLRSRNTSQTLCCPSSEGKKVSCVTLKVVTHCYLQTFWRSHMTSPRSSYHYTFGQQVVSQNQWASKISISFCRSLSW